MEIVCQTNYVAYVRSHKYEEGPKAAPVSVWGAWAKMPAKIREMRAHAAKSTGVGIMARVVSQQQDQYRGVFRWYMAQARAHITQRRLLPLTLSMTMYIVVDFEVMSNVRGM